MDRPNENQQPQDFYPPSQETLFNTRATSRPNMDFNDGKLVSPMSLTYSGPSAAPSIYPSLINQHDPSRDMMYRNIHPVPRMQMQPNRHESPYGTPFQRAHTTSLLPAPASSHYLPSLRRASEHTDPSLMRQNLRLDVPNHPLKRSMSFGEESDTHSPGNITGRENDIVKPAAPTKNANGKFPCMYCTKTYLHAKHLKRHLLRHTGDRPYQCPLCKDTFSRSDILKRHFQKCTIRRGNPTNVSHLSHTHANREAAAAAAQAAAMTENNGASAESRRRSNTSRSSQSNSPMQRTPPIPDSKNMATNTNDGANQSLCEMCSKTKARCDRLSPCGSCKAQGVKCVYYTSRSQSVASIMSDQDSYRMSALTSPTFSFSSEYQFRDSIGSTSNSALSSPLEVTNEGYNFSLQHRNLPNQFSGTQPTQNSYVPTRPLLSQSRYSPYSQQNDATQIDPFRRRDGYRNPFETPSIPPPNQHDLDWTSLLQNGEGYPHPVYHDSQSRGPSDNMYTEVNMTPACTM